MIKAIIFDCFGVVLTDGLRENYEYFGGDFDKDLLFIASVMHEASAGRIESSIPAMAKSLVFPRKSGAKGMKTDTMCSTTY